MSLSVYVIFHDTLHEEYYENLDPDEFDLITFIAVNENIEKKYNTERFKNVIKEWELPIYYPEYQRLKICDHTGIPKSHITDIGVHRHIYENKLCKTDYIWTFHNDMYFYKGSIRQVFQFLQPTHGVTIRAENYNVLVATSTYGYNESVIYNYACKVLGIETHKNYPFHTNCCMSTEMYYNRVPVMIELIESLMNYIVYGPSYRLSICIERLWALAMACKLECLHEVLGILHAHKGQPLIEAMENSKNGTLRQYDRINV